MRRNAHNCGRNKIIIALNITIPAHNALGAMAEANGAALNTWQARPERNGKRGLAINGIKLLPAV